MWRSRLRIPIGMQLGAVCILFAASLATLAFTALAALGREGRRASAERSLAQAGEELASGARTLLAEVRLWPAMSVADWDDLNRRLTARATSVLARYAGVEGGYCAWPDRRFVGAAFPTEPALVAATSTSQRPSTPPPREFDRIEAQVDASIRQGRAIFVVETIPPSVVAIRTAPIAAAGRVVGATWTMTRLVDPIALHQSVRGYSLAAGLALGGIALALVLTVGLARSLRSEAKARQGLQVELRRSERLAALGKLLAGVAHEVRNPLAGIRAITQLWRRGLGQGDEAMAHLLEEVDRLDGIVARLLQFSRAEAQELAPGDLNAVVAEAARLAESQAIAQGVRVELDLGPDLPPVAMAAPALLQVFRNLTLNALQAMPSGGVLRLETARDPARDEVVARVTDTGPGLPAEIYAHLFDPFFTTKAEGTGLGLAIAREIALGHRGELRAANSAEGRGAVFTLILPMVVPAAKQGVRA